MTGNPNRQGLQAFKDAMISHIDSRDIQAISGTYRWQDSVTHYFDPKIADLIGKGNVY